MTQAARRNPNMSTETAVFDDPAFITGRTALGLDALGLHIVSADWGESDMELFMVKQELGEIPAERHPPNRTVTLKLQLKPTVTLTLAEIAHRLQQKINTLQEYGGWCKRVMDIDGKFKRELGCMVYKASVAGLQGWVFAHRSIANEITVVMTCAPYWYSTTEEEQTITSVVSGHEIEWELSEVKGSAPGLIRIELQNNNTGTAGDWHAVIAAAEQQYHSGAATAELGYLAEKLTKFGSAEVGTRTGSAGAHTVKSRLAPTYQPLLGSKIVASGQMTHIGPRVLLLRIWDPNSGAGQISLKLQWKPLGSDYWTENEEISTTLVNGFSILNLGEARPEIATLGNQVWEWRLLGKAATLNQEIEVDKVWLLPTEQFLTAVFEPTSETFAPIMFEDIVHAAAEGGVSGKTPTVGGSYETFGDAVAPIYLNPTIVLESNIYGYERAEYADASTILGSFSVSSTKLSGNLNFSGHLYGWASNLSESRTIGSAFGFVLRYVSTENWLGLVLKTSATGNTKFQIIKCIAGASTILKESSSFIPASLLNTATIEAELHSSGEISARCKIPGSKLEFTLTVSDPVLESAGALKEGKVGIYDYCAGSTARDKVARYYGSLVASKPETEERGAVCYSGKKLELRTDGIFREGVSEAVWARLTPTGFMPKATPSGMENLPLKGIVIPTRGDFESRADSESNSIGLKIHYRPAFLFTSGAS